jgi:hypothetical protein
MTLGLYAEVISLRAAAKALGEGSSGRLPLVCLPPRTNRGSTKFRQDRNAHLPDEAINHAHTAEPNHGSAATSFSL